MTRVCQSRQNGLLEENTCSVVIHRLIILDDVGLHGSTLSDILPLVNRVQSNVHINDPNS